jgi:hypothetical protein
MMRATSKPKRGPTSEWVGGIVSMPSYVTGEGAPYRPEMLLWIDERGLVVGTIMDKPGEVLDRASASLRNTMKMPLIGPAREPSRLRVATAELAAVLRGHHPGIEIACGPTPEIDEFMDGLREKMKVDATESAETYLSDGCDPEAVAAFFRAMAALFRSKPWKIVPADDVLSVTVESHGVRQAAMAIIGHMGESFGFLLFSSMADFEVYIDAAKSIERGDHAVMPSFLALNFERGADLAVSLRKEASVHGWEVASSQAYPWFAVIDKDMVTRPPRAKEMAMVEAIGTALALLASDKAAVKKAFSGGPAFSRTYSVKTHGGDLSVTLRAPHEHR